MNLINYKGTQYIEHDYGIIHKTDPSGRVATQDPPLVSPPDFILLHGGVGWMEYNFGEFPLQAVGNNRLHQWKEVHRKCLP